MTRPFWVALNGMAHNFIELDKAQRRKGKSIGENERYKHLNTEFQRIARRHKKAFFSDQCKETEENNRMKKLEISSRKLDP